MAEDQALGRGEAVSMCPGWKTRLLLMDWGGSWPGAAGQLVLDMPYL
jgi:hypothetical protein